MEELVNQLTVEKAMNGFQVFLKDYKHNGTARPVPYVFETMETLLKFIEYQFNKK
jgi:hypothetical protein